MRLMLDTNVLVRLCHPTGHRDVKDWFRALLARGDAAPEIMISVLAYYELRRSLIAANADSSLGLLDELERSLRVVPVTVDVAQRAAELRRRWPRARPPSDADVLMAAQAGLEGALLVTSDQDLLGLDEISAKDWHQIDPGQAVIGS